MNELTRTIASAKTAAATFDRARWRLADALASLQQQKGNAWTAAFLTTLRLDGKRRKELIAVSLAFPPNARTHALPFSYYRDAWLAHDTSPISLALAVRNNWQPSQFRSHLRHQHAAHPKPTLTTLKLNGHATIYDMRRHAAHELIALPTYSPERARLILSDLGDTATYIDKLKGIANGVGIPPSR